MNKKQLVDYREHRWKFIRWMRFEGKNPEAFEGYSDRYDVALCPHREADREHRDYL